VTLAYNLFWSLRSPNSDLVTLRLIEVERDFLPITVRIDTFFKTVNLLWWAGYLRRNVARTVEMLGHALRYAEPGGSTPRLSPILFPRRCRTYNPRITLP